jgi:NADH:ubiquinone oxidoreductase subunit E
VQSGAREELLIALKRAHTERAHLPKEVMVEISRSLDLPLGEVFGVASFYSFLSTEPRGRHTIRICGSVPCYLKNSEMVARAVGAELGIGLGETTEDGRFSFESTNCIGACDAAPAMLVDADVHGDLTPRKISQILKSYR